MPAFAQASASHSQVQTSSSTDDSKLSSAYKFAFRFQTRLEKSADNREMAGGTGTVFRNFLQGRLKLTDAQFASFRRSAARFSMIEEEQRLWLHQLRAKELASTPGAHTLSLVGQTQVRTHFEQIAKALSTEQTAVQSFVGPSALDAFNARLLKLQQGDIKSNAQQEASKLDVALQSPVRSAAQAVARPLEAATPCACSGASEESSTHCRPR